MVIIPIEMPKNCRECELAYKKLGCQVGGPYDLNGEERPEGCPCIDLCPPDKFISQQSVRITNKVLGWFYSSQVKTLVDTLTRAGVHHKSYTLFDMRVESTCLILDKSEYHVFY